MFDRLLSFYRLFITTLRRRGGLLQVSKTAWSIYRRRGLRGVGRKIGTLGEEFSNKASLETDGNNYLEWIRRYDSPNGTELSAIRLAIERFEESPLISIVMPTYNPHLPWLKQALDSVSLQEYTNWQLCIADDCSTNPEVIRTLNSYAAADSRIKIIARKTNGHISAASNSALEMATGEWVTLLDHDDALSSRALFYVVQAIVTNPEASLIYSDEDKIDESGERFSPYFKNSWNQDLFYSHNLICHLGVYKRSLVNDVGGFREGFEGAQDYDLALRCIEHISPEEIVHVPRILYHWRSHRQSTAQSAMVKPYAITAGARALNEHFTRSGISATAKESDSGYVTCYDLPVPTPSVSIVVLAGDDPARLQQNLERIRLLTNYDNYDIVVVQDGHPGVKGILLASSLADKGGISVLDASHCISTGSGLNLAGHHSPADLLVFLSLDLEPLSSNWLTELAGLASNPQVAAVGPKLLTRDGKILQGGYVFGMSGEPVVGQSYRGVDGSSAGYFGRLKSNSRVTAVSLACLVVDRKKFLDVRGFDETGSSGLFLDVDLCLRLSESGLRIVWSAHVEMYNEKYEASRAAPDALIESSLKYMARRWPRYIGNDPVYSPNMCLHPEGDLYAWPPRIPDIFLRYRCGNLVSSRPPPALATAVAIHVHYIEVLEELFELLKLVDVRVKVFVTSPKELIEHISGMFEAASFEFEVRPVDNQGRDILPFLLVLPGIIEEGYDLVLKLHTKKSVKRLDGDRWRSDLYGKLLNPGKVREAAKYFQQNSQLGMIGPAGHLVPMERHWGRNKRRVGEYARRMGVSEDQLCGRAFVAGSMFYARASALQPLLDLGLCADDFERENGQTDGTLAHVVERLFAISANAAGQDVVDLLLGSSGIVANHKYEFSDG